MEAYSEHASSFRLYEACCGGGSSPASASGTTVLDFILGRSGPPSSQLPPNASAEMNDSDIAVVLSGSGKRKYHSCEVCDLPVAYRVEECDPPRYRSLSTIQISDMTYCPQKGPVCGAASVAGTARSLAKYHGLSDEIISKIDTPSIQELYKSMGVPDVDTTTAAVGNATIKRAFMQLKIDNQYWTSAAEFGSLFEKCPVARMDADWQRLKRGMVSGLRYLYHCRNHYTRIFGYRELYEQPATEAVAVEESNMRQPYAAPADSVPLGPSRSANSSAAPVAASEDTAASGKVIGSGKSAVVVKEGSTVDELTAAPLCRPRGARREEEECRSAPMPAFLADMAACDENNDRTDAGAGAPSGTPKETTIAVFGYTNRTATSVRNLPQQQQQQSKTPTGNQYAVAARDGREPETLPQQPVERLILIAKRGQRPQHWVRWEDVYRDLETHKLAKIFEIRMK